MNKKNYNERKIIRKLKKKELNKEIYLFTLILMNFNFL